MTTVTQLLDHLIKAAGDMGKLKDPIPSALIKARARIQHLEGQLATTETMRDRIAMQLLPAIQDKVSRGTPAFDTDDCIRLAYHQADKVLRIRVEGSAGAPGETTSPEIRGFQIGTRVRSVKSARVGTVITSPTDEPDLCSPDWTFVRFREDQAEGIACLTKNLELVGEEQ